MNTQLEEMEQTPAVADAACTRTCGLSAMRGALSWTAMPLHGRLKVLRAARHRMAYGAEEFAAAISPRLSRNSADTLVTELLPLLAACKFLERDAPRLLKPRKLGLGGRPLWMGGVHAEVHREPLGHVLIVGPSNFPLFVPGVQALQALAAGNTVTWKPGAGGRAVAELVARALRETGLPQGALTITGESMDDARQALAARPDKVIFTGSSASGSAVMAELAATATPAVMELAGADAVVVMPGADLLRVARCVAFGLRLNGGAVCMSPRRLFATAETLTVLRPLLTAELAKIPPARLEERTTMRLESLLREAAAAGASISSAGVGTPILVDHATPDMAITQTDIFAPVISLIETQSLLHLAEMYASCPYALTVAIFCAPREEKRARAAARQLRAGTVLINDLIAPTVDPRVPFGGRGASGFGVTRGSEGLLEMTAIKTLLVRRPSPIGYMLHLDATTDADAPMFAGAIGLLHGKGFSRRWDALRQMVRGAKHRVQR